MFRISKAGSQMTAMMTSTQTNKYSTPKFIDMVSLDVDINSTSHTFQLNLQVVCHLTYMWISSQLHTFQLLKLTDFHVTDVDINSFQTIDSMSVYVSPELLASLFRAS